MVLFLLRDVQKINFLFYFHRLYFSERNIKGMFETLEPLHAMLERGPQTLKETSFNQAYGRDLTQALECCQHFKVIK